ncbi:MAG: SH3 domain-containing protein [Proteobacteria bacterium]|nr:SH3 domain-containing protein [Pseudomonadota bacterium]MBU1742590.1 SH3 domain-containing protein [Pseudomonadota bacterium]
MSRKLLVIIAAIAAVGLLIPSAALPASAPTLYVQRPQVDIHAGPASYYVTVCVARRGEALIVLAQDGGWVKVKAAGGIGWVYKTALSPRRSGPTTPAKRFGGNWRFSGFDQTAGIKLMDLCDAFQHYKELF